MKFSGLPQTAAGQNLLRPSLLLICLLVIASYPVSVRIATVEGASRQSSQRGFRHKRPARGVARKSRQRPRKSLSGKPASIFEPVSDEGEESEFGEDLGGRESWFLFQRTYPGDALPVGGRPRAWECRPVRRNKDGLLPLAVGQRWRAIGPAPTTSAFPNNWGTTSGRINAIAVSPANPQIVLAGAATGGIWRSIDDGANFAPVSDAQVDLSVGSIVFSRSNPSIVYAGMGDAYDGYLGTGVLKSTDSGQTWMRISNSSLPGPGTVLKIEVDPANPDRVYLAQFTSRSLTANTNYSGGLFVSTDGGVNWRRTFTGMARDVVIHPTNPQTLYLAMSRVDQGGLSTSPPGLYRSDDGGLNWTRIFTTPYDYTQNQSPRILDIKVAVTPANAQKIYVLMGGYIGSNFDVRVAVSSNGGTTWIDQGAPGIDKGQFGYNSYITVDPTNTQTVYVGTRDLYKSTNGGASWTNLTRNFDSAFNYRPTASNTHPDQHALAFSPIDANTLYIGNDGGVSKSTDGGSTFRSLNATLSLTQFISITLHPTDPTISYGGTQDNGTQKRIGATNQWHEFAEGDGGRSVLDYNDPSTVFTAYRYGIIRRWRNHGATSDLTTSNAAFGEPNTNPRIALYPPFTGNGANSTLYFGTYRLFTSTNQGATWTAPGGTFDQTKGGTDVLSAIGVSRANPNVIYTGSRQGRVMVSTNGGALWLDISAGLPNRFVSSITVDTVNPLIAYLTVSGYGTGHVFKTVTGGTAWIDISGNLPNIPTNTLLVDPLNPTILYAGTDVGVFRSSSDGAVWEAFNNGLPPVVVTAFAANSRGQIQLATYGRGAYELGASSTQSWLQFSNSNYTVAENEGRAMITVSRTGDISGVATVEYSTIDNPALVRCDVANGRAYARCDYSTTIDTLRFAPGETQKSFTIPIVDDAYVEGAETVQIALSNATGTALGGQSTVTLTITDNDTAAGVNPIFNIAFFVRQQYLDFLSREPEQSGLDAWTGVLSRCPNVNNDPHCDRTEVSSSFFRSDEFQLKGYFVYRFYKVSFGRLPNYGEIITDMRSVAVQTGAEVTAKKEAFTNAWIQRSEFRTAYDPLTDAASFVDKLLQTVGVTLTGAVTRDSLVQDLRNGAKTRAGVVRAIVEHPDVDRKEYNGAFVAMQYFGYLRRDPDLDGYNAWLRVINANPLDYRTMVDGFSNSTEYKLRFGQP